MTIKADQFPAHSNEGNTTWLLDQPDGTTVEISYRANGWEASLLTFTSFGDGEDDWVGKTILGPGAPDLHPLAEAGFEVPALVG